MMASSNTEDGVGPVCDIERNISAKPPVYALAKAALDAVYQRADTAQPNAGYDTVREAWAEAAQLLRDGWVPGNELISMNEAAELRAKKLPPLETFSAPETENETVSSIEEAKLDKYVEAKHDAMNAAGVPSDIETVKTETEEVRTIDNGPAAPADNTDAKWHNPDSRVCSPDCEQHPDMLPELTVMNEQVAAALDSTPVTYIHPDDEDREPIGGEPPCDAVKPDTSAKLEPEPIDGINYDA